MNNIATSVATCRTIVRIIHENKSIYKLNGDLGTFHFRRQYCSRVEMEKDLWGLAAARPLPNQSKFFEAQ
jgi:hypothetical protein